MATPAAKATHVTPPGMHHAEAHGPPPHIEHHYSWAPLLLGLGALVTLVGLEFVTWNGLPIFPVLGVLIVALAFGVWIKEDVHFWNVRHVDLGVLPGKYSLEWWGLLFFLGTEVMLFGGLFAVYFVGNGEYPAVFNEGAHHLDLVTTAINTAILVASSFTLHFGEKQLFRGNRRGFILWLLVTIVLGGIFLGLQVLEYKILIGEGNVISKDVFWSVFYQLTGTHGVHVTLGLILLLIVLVRALMGQFDAERHDAVTIFSIYWHFVDVVWVFLFLTVYALPHYGVI